MTVLGDLISPAQLDKCGTRDFPVLSMTMHDGIMLQSERFKKSLASIDQSAYKVVQRNQLVVGFPIDEGVLYIQKVVDAGIMSPAYDVWNVKQDIVNLDYLELSLHSPQSMLYYRTNLRGSTARRRSLPKEILLSLPVKLPDMESQRRVVSVIAKVKDIILLYKRLLSALDNLIKARFVEMFGDPISNTKQLETDYLKDVLVLKAGDFTSASDISEEPSTLKKYPCYGGNGIRGYVAEYNHEGDYSLIGRQGALSGNVQYATGRFKNTEHALLVSPSIPMNSIWLNKLLINLDLKRYQTGAAQPGLSVKNLQEIKIISVPLEEQNKYASFVSQVDKSKSAIQKSLDETQLLFDSLMQQYFG